MLATRKKPKLSREAMLNSRPARNELLKWEKTDSGEARITVVRQETWKVRMLSRLFYVPRERKITLDEVGSEVWQMCDGRTTVAQMIDALRNKYKLDRKEAEVSLLSYLKTLGQKRFLGFVLEGEQSTPEQSDSRARQGKGKASGKRWE